MIKLINVGFQGYNVFLKTETSLKSIWVNAKETIVIPRKYISEQLNRMIQKKLFKVEGIKK